VKVTLMLKLLTPLVVLILATAATAGPGHDHGDAAPAATSNAPKRQPDGSVFLPKPSQRQLAVRTALTQEQALPRTVVLSGRVVMDPAAGGKVQPLAAGRIEPGPRGLPSVGQRVRRGEVLALVRSAAAPIERANQVAAGAELRAQLQAAERNAERLRQLEGSVPRKEIEAAVAEAEGLRQRLAAVGGSVDATEALRAPVDGVVAAVHAVAGQVVDARELVFEIVDPARLQVEASAFDAALAAEITSATATATAGGAAVPLAFVGAGRVQREGALPLVFRTRPGAAGSGAVPLAVGQPVTLVAQMRSTVTGIALPAASVVKNPSNQDIVWVHTGPEQFVPRTVRWVALDGARVVVLEDLKPGERAVVQGAPLVNQVR
jgi:membrane fusion protein, heavy metal efflux system